MQESDSTVVIDVQMSGENVVLTFTYGGENDSGFVVAIPHREAVELGLDIVTAGRALRGGVIIERDEADEG